MSEHRRVGLALSGGGVRAMAFHCGVLRWLAENKQIEDVVHVSTVSGGSLFTGLMFKLSDWQWPSSEQFLLSHHPQIRKILTEKDLLISAIKRLLLPKNWRFLLSRANVISQTIEHCWGISAQLSNLPEMPVWSVNGTTAETGRRFRFKRSGCGDYELGYAEAYRFKVADAMATSAAFPIGIGPFVIKTEDLVWYRRESWDSPPNRIKEVKLPFDRLHIYDGGVYDNLGIEPLFDMGTQKLKDGVDRIIVSDAGASLKRGPLGWALNPFRAKRVADIALDQTRALRVRSFINFIKTNPSSGKYLQLGTEALSQIEKFRAQNDGVSPPPNQFFTNL
ncbi:MAG: patatin-like phospholipase family protein [Candidatus Manganitrophus sp.]|nr:MAG: patatin-like phospholipase family protein [Candidatus Manganitrophus sp.]